MNEIKVLTRNAREIGLAVRICHQEQAAWEWRWMLAASAEQRDRITRKSTRADERCQQATATFDEAIADLRTAGGEFAAQSIEQRHRQLLQAMRSRVRTQMSGSIGIN